IDDGLRQLAQAALQTPAPVVSAFDDPSCAPVIGAAAVTAAGPVAIVLADRSSLVVRVESLSNLSDGRVFVLQQNGQTVGTSVVSAPELTTWLGAQHAADGARRVSGQPLVRSWAPLAGGWTLVVEQGAVEFGGGGVPQSSNFLPALIAGCFAFAIVVVG